jgi:hypothetical protein
VLGDPQAAEKYFASCLKTREVLFKSDDKNLQRKIELMLVQARMGRRKEAAKAAEEVVAFAPKHPGKLFQAACAYAQCISSVSNVRNFSPPSSENRKLQEEYTAKALAVLRQAVAHGFKDRKGLQTAPDLEPLRENKAFQEILVQIGK